MNQALGRLPKASYSKRCLEDTFDDRSAELQKKLSPLGRNELSSYNKLLGKEKLMAEQFSFEVASSSTGEIYHVSVVREGTNLTCTCTCPAGRKRTACKHRLGILQGHDGGVTGGDIESIARMPTLLNGTDVEKAMNDLTAIELEIATLKKRATAAKKALGRVLDD
ncbi:SWIM zinc finger family protein [Ruegeria sp. YS9]|uniref:SWIM zinc finger family protein n=1 Tax=Ruegeria sp. YS9 TaxID=2966453 RepID=UPI00214BCCA4|nr:SWIM zinc finger family protein [Ruegeria sp. YS9]UUV04806.1 hypothetical protein NOR97_09160 [Ruegeria sp. YS9]